MIPINLLVFAALVIIIVVVIVRALKKDEVKKTTCPVCGKPYGGNPRKCPHCGELLRWKQR